jgi:hypothetical protein
MDEQKTERELLGEISSKLDRVVGLLATAGKEAGDQIRILRYVGFDWNEIGQFVGLKPDAARMRFNSLKGENGSRVARSPTKTHSEEGNSIWQRNRKIVAK